MKQWSVISIVFIGALLLVALLRKPRLDPNYILTRNTVARSSNGRFAAVHTGSSITVFQKRRSEPLWKLDISDVPIDHVSLSPDGKVLLLSGFTSETPCFHVVIASPGGHAKVGCSEMKALLGEKEGERIDSEPLVPAMKHPGHRHATTFITPDSFAVWSSESGSLKLFDLSGRLLPLTAQSESLTLDRLKAEALRVIGHANREAVDTIERRLDLDEALLLSYWLAQQKVLTAMELAELGRPTVSVVGVDEVWIGINNPILTHAAKLRTISMDPQSLPRSQAHLSHLLKSGSSYQVSVPIKTLRSSDVISFQASLRFVDAGAGDTDLSRAWKIESHPQPLSFMRNITNSVQIILEDVPRGNYFISGAILTNGVRAVKFADAEMLLVNERRAENSL